MTLFPMLSEMLEGDHYDVPKTQAKMTKAFIRPYTRRSAQPARKRLFCRCAELRSATCC
jgi:hypothetical protein